MWTYLKCRGLTALFALLMSSPHKDTKQATSTPVGPGVRLVRMPGPGVTGRCCRGANRIRKGSGNYLVAGEEDDACRAIAEKINQGRPQWLITWGCYSRLFWAYPLFEMRPRMLAHAWYPKALLARMDDAEQRFRVWSGNGEVTRDDTSPGRI